MFPNSELANGEQLIYATAYGSTDGDGQGSLSQSIAAVIRHRMQIMNAAELVDVQVTTLSASASIENEAGVLLTLRVRTKDVSVSEPVGGIIVT